MMLFSYKRKPQPQKIVFFVFEIHTDGIVKHLTGLPAFPYGLDFKFIPYFDADLRTDRLRFPMILFLFHKNVSHYKNTQSLLLSPMNRDYIFNSLRVPPISFLGLKANIVQLPGNPAEIESLLSHPQNGHYDFLFGIMIQQFPLKFF